MEQVDGADYLYQHKNSYIVRIQVPASLRRAVGKSELKKSVGTDIVQARRDRHGVIADFQRIIEQARTAPGTQARLSPSPVSFHDIDLAVHDHFTRMAILMRGKPVGNSDVKGPQSRALRLEGLQQHIDLLLDVLDSGHHSMAQAEWLCEEQGWTIPEDSSELAYLRRKMLEARLASYQHEKKLLETGSIYTAEIDPFFAGLRPKRQKPALSLGNLIDKFNAEREAAWSASTKKNYVIITRVIEEACGRSTPLDIVDRDFCLQIRDLLTKMPVNYQKKKPTRGRAISDVIEIAKLQNMPLLMPATVNAHLNKLGAIIRYGRDRGWISGNPMADMDVNDPVDASEKRDPFDIQQLNQIFSTAPWDGPLDPKSTHPARYWLPLNSLFTGARLGEISGVRTEEIVERDGINLLHIRHRPDRKTKSGRSRYIPIHSTLIAMGLLAFVDAQKAAKRDYIFPEEKANSLEHWGDSTSDWFSRMVKRLGLRGTKLSVHSFRHCFEDALREADLHDTPIGNALTGRSSGSVSGNYGTRYSNSKLQTAIERVEYPKLSLAHLIPS